MRFVDEYRSGELAQKLAREIASLVDAGRELQDHGGLRRAHARDLQARARGPAPARGRLRARARLPGLRDPDGPCRRRDRTRRAARSDPRHLRRHAARAGRPRARCSRRRRAAPTCGWSTRRSTRSSSRARNPDRRGRLLRDRLRDDGPRDGADAPPRPRATGSATSPSSATTSRSGRRCGRSSTRPDCGSTAFIAPGHVSTVIGTRRLRLHRRATTAGRSSSRRSSRSTSSRRS